MNPPQTGNASTKDQLKDHKSKLNANSECRNIYGNPYLNIKGVYAGNHTSNSFYILEHGLPIHYTLDLLHV